MRTATTFVAEARSRTLCLLVLFTLAVFHEAVGQPAHVEWVRFEENGQSYLALNAYETAAENPRSGEAESAAAYPPAVSAAVGVPSTEVAAPHLPPAAIHGMVIEYPVRNAPEGPAVDAFLGVLEQVDGASPVQSTWKPETLNEWTNLLRVLTSREEVWLHGRVINSREVTPDLKNVYALRGHPTTEQPIFPHLSRGVLAVSDSDGRPLTSLSVDFAGRESHNPVYELVTFENLGSRPLKVFTDLDKYSPIRLSGTEITLEPRERTTRLITLEPSIFSTGKEESRALVRFVSGGVEAEAFEVKAVHAGWTHGIAGALASATTSLFGTWSAGATLPVAAAIGVLLFAFVLLGVRRNSLGVTISEIGGHHFRRAGVALRPQRYISEAVYESGHRIIAGVRSGSNQGMAMLRRVAAAASRVSATVRVLLRQFGRALASRAEMIRRARVATASNLGPESASLKMSAADANSDEATMMVSAAGAWARFLAWTQDVLLPAGRERAISLAQETRERLGSQAKAAGEAAASMAMVAGRMLTALAEAIGPWSASVVTAVVRIGSGFAETSKRNATALARLLARHATSLIAAARPRFRVLRESARRRLAELPEIAGEMMVASLRATTTRTAAVLQATSRFAAASARSTRTFTANLRGSTFNRIASIWSGAQNVASSIWRQARDVASSIWRSAQDAAASIWRSAQDAASSIRRRTRKLAAAVRTGAGGSAAGLRTEGSDPADLLREPVGRLSLRRDFAEGSDGGAAPFAGNGTSSLAFSQPLRSQAASLRETAARLAAVLKQDLAPSATPRGGILLRRVPQRAGTLMHSVIDRIMRLTANLYIYREWTAAPIEPIDGSECVNRMQRLINEMDPASPRDAPRILRKEAKRLARRLESDLERELVPRTTMNFQVLWALRLLCKILDHPPKNFSVAVRNWLNGAERVVRSQGRDGIGPTVPEFLSYL